MRLVNGYLAYGEKTIYIHREAASQILGRPLLSSEVVHHIDENRSNNDLSNLMVFRSNSDHIAHHSCYGTRTYLCQDGVYECPSKVKIMTKESDGTLLKSVIKSRNLDLDKFYPRKGWATILANKWGVTQKAVRQFRRKYHASYK